MIKVYKEGDYWIAECTSLDIMVSTHEKKESIVNLCDTLKCFLIESEQRNKLDKILDDQIK